MAYLVGRIRLRKGSIKLLSIVYLNKDKFQRSVSLGSHLFLNKRTGNFIVFN